MIDSNSPQQNTVVLEIAGKVTIGYDAKMRDAIAGALEDGAQNILLNMRNVSRIDSSGIGELVAAHNNVTGRGGRLLLVGLPARLASVLQITNLLGILELYSTPEEALEALGSKAE